MDKIVHFEIPFDDAERAKKFYSDVFAWQITPYPEMNYNIVRTVEVDDKQMPKESGAINGGMMKRGEVVKSPVLVINVANIDESIGKIKQSGGKILQDKMNVGDMGILAYFQDCEGNVLGLWQELKQ